MISTPFTSSPWTAALIQTVGPGLAPLTTMIGSVRLVPVGQLGDRNFDAAAFAGVHKDAGDFDGEVADFWHGSSLSCQR